MKFLVYKLKINNFLQFVKKKNKKFIKIINKGGDIFFLHFPQNIYIYRFKDHFFFLTFLVNKASLVTFISQINNLIDYSEASFEIFFTLKGFSYRIEKKKNFLIFFLAYTHPIVIKLPSYVFCEVFNETNFMLASNYQLNLLKIGICLKKLRLLNVYSGKGIFEIDEKFFSKKVKNEKKK